MCLWVSVFDLIHPPPRFFSSFSTLWTPCPAAEWHSNNEWCFCSRRLYWLWALWASLSFTLLGDYFEIKEKVDVTWEFLCFLSLLSYLCIKPQYTLFLAHFLDSLTTLLSFFVVVATRTMSLYSYAGFCSWENSGNPCKARWENMCIHVGCPACVPELLSCLELLLNQHKASTVCACACVRSPGARGCVKYNCCVRKWKVSICRGGGSHETVRSHHWETSHHSDSWTNDAIMWRCGVMMPDYHTYWRSQLKCIKSRHFSQYDASFSMMLKQKKQITVLIT